MLEAFIYWSLECIYLSQIFNWKTLTHIIWLFVLNYYYHFIVSWYEFLFNQNIWRILVFLFDFSILAIISSMNVNVPFKHHILLMVVFYCILIRVEIINLLAERMIYMNSRWFVLIVQNLNDVLCMRHCFMY